MVKSKQLKVLRKRLLAVEKTDPAVVLTTVQRAFSNVDSLPGKESSFPGGNTGYNSKDSLAEKQLPSIGRGEETQSDNMHFEVEHRTSAAMSLETQRACYDLFEDNMGDFYRKSSWGLNANSKMDELQHRKAQFLIVRSTDQSERTAINSSEKEDETVNCTHSDSNSSTRSIVAFVHFRFEYDDEEAPSCVVLYVYEIQVAATVRRKGLGVRLMQAVEAIASVAPPDTISKVMLTVFKANEGALGFYVEKLGYDVDETSPSRCGEIEDYEVLSKKC